MIYVFLNKYNTISYIPQYRKTQKTQKVVKW